MGNKGNVNNKKKSNDKALWAAIVVLSLLLIGSLFAVVKYRNLNSENEGRVTALTNQGGSLQKENNKLKEEKFGVDTELATSKTELATSKASLENLQKDLVAKDKQLVIAKRSNEQAKNVSGDDLSIKLKDALDGKAKAEGERDIALAKNKEIQLLLDEAKKARDVYKAQAEEKKKVDLGENVASKSSGREAELDKKLKDSSKEVELTRAELAFTEAASLVALAPRKTVEKAVPSPNEGKSVVFSEVEEKALLDNLNLIKNAAAWYMVNAANRSSEESFLVAKQAIERIQAVDITGLPNEHQTSIKSLQERWIKWQDQNVEK